MMLETSSNLRTEPAQLFPGEPAAELETFRQVFRVSFRILDCERKSCLRPHITFPVILLWKLAIKAGEILISWPL